MSEGNGFANKDAFFSGFTRRWKEVDCALLGGKVVIGSMSEKEHQRFERRLEGMRKKKTIDNIRLAYMCECVWLPDKSARMFNAEDLEQFMASEVDYAVTRQLMDEILKHVGVQDDDLGELAKN